MKKKYLGTVLTSIFFKQRKALSNSNYSKKKITDSLSFVQLTEIIFTKFYFNGTLPQRMLSSPSLNDNTMRNVHV